MPLNLFTTTCVKPFDDLSVMNLNNLAFMVQQVSIADIKSSRILNSRVMELHIDLGIRRFRYKPGQFVAMSPHIDGRPSNEWSYYSIASGPNGHNGFDLCVSIDGFRDIWPSSAEHEQLEGQKVTIKGPSGVFTLPAKIDKDLVFMATGTGVAPFRSMLQYILREQIPHKSIHLIYGGRFESEILYRNEFEELVEQLPGFTYDIILSRDPLWKGHKGRLRDFYMKAYSEPREDVLFYLCGWPDMVRDGLRDLIDDLGYHPSQLIYELYG